MLARVLTSPLASAKSICRPFHLTLKELPSPQLFPCHFPYTICSVIHLTIYPYIVSNIGICVIFTQFPHNYPDTNALPTRKSVKRTIYSFDTFSHSGAVQTASPSCPDSLRAVQTAGGIITSDYSLDTTKLLLVVHFTVSFL